MPIAANLDVGRLRGYAGVGPVDGPIPFRVDGNESRFPILHPQGLSRCEVQDVAILLFIDVDDGITLRERLQHGPLFVQFRPQVVDFLLQGIITRRSGQNQEEER